ncbi:redoxin domain-containing protein [bacterium]|nr:redoxin domain-containing protein [bacterium]
MPDIEKHIDKFKAEDTQVLSISVDSKFCHDNWATSLGGISYPLLADFHPKGAVAEKYGLYIADKGINDRATVIIDKKGVVQYAHSVGLGGLRKAEDLLKECGKVNSENK